MKTEAIVFSDLVQLLSRLGFTQHSVENQEVFQHIESDTSIVLPHYELREILRPIHVVGTRKILVEKGLMESSKFDADHARQGSWEDFQAILAQVPDREPDPFDRL